MFRNAWLAPVIAVLLAGGIAPPAAAADQARDAQTARQEAARERPPLRGLARVPERRGAADQEPAFARGYSDGYARGLADSGDRDRYDPVGHRDYRAADQGYSRSYGSRDVYRDNYRAGFRRGYDEGYRAGGRGEPAGLYGAPSIR